MTAQPLVILTEFGLDDWFNPDGDRADADVERDIARYQSELGARLSAAFPDVDVSTSRNDLTDTYRVLGVELEDALRHTVETIREDICDQSHDWPDVT